TLRLLRDRMLVSAGHDVDAAAQKCLQGLGATGKVEDFDVEPFLLEIAVALGDRERQIVDKRLAADTDRELRFFEPLRARERSGQQHCKRECNQFRHAAHRSSPEVTRKKRGHIVGASAACRQTGEYAARRSATPLCREAHYDKPVSAASMMRPRPQRR